MSAHIVKLPMTPRLINRVRDQRRSERDMMAALDYWYTHCLKVEATLKTFITRAREAELMVERLRIALAIATRPDSQHRVDQALTNH
jgi:hypothetical protein